MFMGKYILKGRVKTLLARNSAVRGFATIATKHRPRIFMYHRFSREPHSEPTVIDAAMFEWQVREIKQRFLVHTMRDYIRKVRDDGGIPPRTAIITVDDGYRDFYEIAYPILRKHGVRATLFVTVNFIERKIWLWPDILRFALENAQVKSISFPFESATFEVPAGDPGSIRREWESLSDFCIRLDDDTKWTFISKLLAAARVDLPSEPITEYAPVTWEQIREMKEKGIEIGSHTLNHPILSKVREERRLVEEIGESRRAIEARIGDRVATFCYPNGTPEDIDERVVALVKEAGYHGAVVTVGALTDDLYRIPRIGVSSEKTDFLWKASGLENITGQYHDG
jgi:peptidoglycan/xylan/chitin deacetylase (PgdA/CDA1 family)